MDKNDFVMVTSKILKEALYSKAQKLVSLQTNQQISKIDNHIHWFDIDNLGRQNHF